MRASALRCAFAISSLVAPASAAEAQDDIWRWQMPMAPGATVEVLSVVGDISATPATGPNVEVVGRTTRGRTGSTDVRIVVTEQSNGVRICTRYPAQSGDDENECGGGSGSNDTRVDFEVRVPRGVRFSGGTVSGNVEASGMSAYTRGSTVSGNVRISTSDVAEASTVSGAIDATLGRGDWSGALRFSSVSGSIVVHLPPQLDASVDATTVSGSVRSDWPVTISDGWGSRKLSGTIGRGGGELTLRTVTGPIDLRRN